MNTYARLLKYVAPYWKRVILLLLTITVFAALSGVSLTLIPPFLKILLYDDAPAITHEEPAHAAEGASGAQGMPLPGAVERAKDSLQTRFESFMYTGGRKDRLYRFCKVLLLLVLLKVRITSAAERPSSLWKSVGIPRPSSFTETEPSE